jgi:hypothetical protein
MPFRKLHCQLVEVFAAAALPADRQPAATTVAGGQMRSRGGARTYARQELHQHLMEFVHSDEPRREYSAAMMT